MPIRMPMRLWRLWCVGVLERARRHVRSRAPGRRVSCSHEAGFSLIEVVMAITLFAILSAALAGVLTAAIGARSGALQRTKAEQIANQQLEWIRSLDYLQVGLTATGQVRGVIDKTGNQSAYDGPTVPSGYTVEIKIGWVDDPTPTSYTQFASYKNILVTVSRASDSKQLTHQSTQIGPRTRAAFGGIATGAIEAVVVDYYSGGVGPMQGVDVTLGTGPSAPLDETTNQNGAVRFSALAPNPSSGTTAYYDLDVPTFQGYVLAANSLATHMKVAPGETVGPKTLQVYRPLILTIPINNSDGTPFTGTAQVKVSNSRGSRTFTYSGTPLIVTQITNSTSGQLESLVPEPYTIVVLTGVLAEDTIVSVPAGYPTTTSVTAPITALATGDLTATVTWGGLPVSGATVTVTGGPKSVNLSQTTNGSGVVSFSTLSAGVGYTVTATKSGQSASAAAGVTPNVTTSVPLALPVGGVLASVTASGSPLAGATVKITGGPMSLTGVSATTGATGQVSFSGIPVGSGYTVSAEVNGSTISASASVTSGSTTNVTLAWPVGSIAATVQWLGANVSGATVLLTGGPFVVSQSQTTGATGKVTFSNLAEGVGYTLTVTKSGASTTASVAVTGGSTTNTTVAMPTGTIALSGGTLTWAGTYVPSASVTVAGGPLGSSYAGTTNSTGALSITVPATTSANPYTVTVSKNGYSAAATVPSVPAGSTVTPTVTFSATGTISFSASTLQWAGQFVPGASVSITGGPNSGVTYAATTDSAGAVSVAVPATTSTYPYTVSVSQSSGSASALINSLAAGATTSPTVDLTPTKSIRITVQRNGSNLTSTAVVVSITGGPAGSPGTPPSYGGTYTTDTSGRISNITVPSGSSGGYTVKVYLGNCGAFSTLRSGSAAGVSSTGTGTTSVTVSLTANACPFSPLP